MAIAGFIYPVYKLQSTQKFVLYLYISCTATFLLSIMHLQIFNDYVYQKYNEKCKRTIWFYMWFLFLPTVIIEIFCLVARAPGNYFAVNVVQVSLLVVALMSAFYVFIARWRLRGNVRNITMTAISILYVFVLIPSTAFLSVSKFLFDAYGSTDKSDIVASTFVSA